MDSQTNPSFFFWQAIGLAFACGTGGFALVAPILTQINDSFGKMRCPLFTTTLSLADIFISLQRNPRQT